MLLSVKSILLAVVLGLVLAAAVSPDAAATAAPRTTTGIAAPQTVHYAPLNRPGPALSILPSHLRSALSCHGPLGHSPLETVLLNPATGVTPKQNFSWNYGRLFTMQHRPWCTVTMPFSTLGDIQNAGEYLVYAIRTVHQRAGRRIAVMGHSQGGMSMRWALRFWPDTRRMVDDVIGMAGSNHGTTVPLPCRVGVTKCVPADWQQGASSNFIAALNSGQETFRGISYTEIFTHTDEVVQPNSTDATSSSALHTGRGAITNASTQDICPLDVDEHLLVGTVDPAAYGLAEDALDHAGPANPGRVSRTLCTKPAQPGVDFTTLDTYVQALEGAPGLLAVSTPDVNLVGAPEVPAEPALRCYTLAAGC